MRTAGCLLLRLAAVLAILLTGCAKSAASERAAAAAPIRVFAAASLTIPFAAVARAFEQEHADSKVELNCAGTPQLVLQIREGAAADVFASADQRNMHKVVAAGAVLGSPVEFARNQLTIVVKAGNPRHLRGLADLARSDLKVALCGATVPAGEYARQALQKANVAVQSVSDEPSVKALVSKVLLGEIDAGVVYVTDARVQGVTAVPIASQHNVVASYPIAVLSVGGNPDGGRQFVAFVRSAVGRAILADNGFSLP